MNEYTEEQIRADVQLIERADLDDEIVLALMRLASGLCDAPMIRGLIARNMRERAIVRAISGRAANRQDDGGEQVDVGRTLPRTTAGLRTWTMPTLAEVTQLKVADALLGADESFARCGMCGTEHSAEEYAKLDSARGSHFRQCKHCSQFEVTR